MEFPDDLWKMIKEYQLDYETKERFFNNLNSDVYSFNEFTSFYYDDSDDEDYEWRHIVWKVNNKYSDDLTGRCKLVTKDGKTWKLKVEYIDRMEYKEQKHIIYLSYLNLTIMKVYTVNLVILKGKVFVGTIYLRFHCAGHHYILVV